MTQRLGTSGDRLYLCTVPDEDLVRNGTLPGHHGMIVTNDGASFFG